MNMGGKLQTLPIGVQDFATLRPATGDGEPYAQLHRSGGAFVDLSPFLREMRRFLERFLHIEVYEHCYGMVATCYDGYSVWTPFYGMEDSVYDFHEMRKVCQLNGITPERGGLAHWKDPMRTRRAKETPTIPSGMERARLAFI